MKVLGRDFYPRTYLRFQKDAFCRLIGFLFKPQKSFTFIDKSSVRRIIDYYGGNEGHKIDKKSGNLGYGFIHYALIRNLQPKKVLCVGSGRGFIPAVCALACKDNKKGMVDFVDSGYSKEHPQSWAGNGFWKKGDIKKHFSLLGIEDRIKTQVMTSKSFAEKYPKTRYGYIYIDGDHSYKGVKLDYQLFWPRLKKGGFMAFHDVTVKKWGKLSGFGVYKLWEEIKSNHKIIFPLKQSGLGILQK
jgi:hypothetical protein